MSTTNQQDSKTADIDVVALVEKVAKATKLEGVAVEVRQNGKRPVITITDDVETRVLAYVTPKRKGGFSLEIVDYGGRPRRESAATVAAAAKLVKTSKRVKPKTKPAPKPETATETAAAQAVADAVNNPKGVA